MSLPDAIIARNHQKGWRLQAMLDGSMRVINGALASDSLRHDVGLDEVDSAHLLT